MRRSVGSARAGSWIGRYSREVFSFSLDDCGQRNGEGNDAECTLAPFHSSHGGLGSGREEWSTGGGCGGGCGDGGSVHNRIILHFFGRCHASLTSFSFCRFLSDTFVKRRGASKGSWWSTIKKSSVMRYWRQWIKTPTVHKYYSNEEKVSEEPWDAIYRRYTTRATSEFSPHGMITAGCVASAWHDARRRWERFSQQLSPPGNCTLEDLRRAKQKRLIPT